MSAVPDKFAGATVVGGAALCAGSAALQIAISNSLGDDGTPTDVQQFLLVAISLVGFAAAFVLATGLVAALWAFYDRAPEQVSELAGAVSPDDQGDDQHDQGKDRG